MNKLRYAYFSFLIVLSLQGCAYFARKPYVGKNFHGKEEKVSKKEEPVKEPVVKNIAVEEEKTKVIKKYTLEQKEEKKKEIKAKYLQEQLSKGDGNYKKGNYKQARKDYLTIYFIDPTNEIVLSKLRSLPIIRPPKVSKSAPVIQSPVSTPAHKAATGEHFVYTIKPGDTLAAIARKFYGDYKNYTLLAQANRIQAPYTVHGGQSIVIPKDTTIEQSLEEHKKKGRNCLLGRDYECAIKEYTSYLLMASDDAGDQRYQVIKDLKNSYYEHILRKFDMQKFAETTVLIGDLNTIASKYKIDLSDLSDDIDRIQNSMVGYREEEKK